MVTRSFLTAGRAIFTVEPPPGLVSQGCRAHYTFQIRRKEVSGRWREPAWFASLLTGPENTRNFTYLGKLNTETGEVHLTQASRFNDQTWPVWILRRVLDHIWRGEGDRADRVEGVPFGPLRSLRACIDCPVLHPVRHRP
jgi:hypothetical protein